MYVLVVPASAVGARATTAGATASASARTAPNNPLPLMEPLLVGPRGTDLPHVEPTAAPMRLANRGMAGMDGETLPPPGNCQRAVLLFEAWEPWSRWQRGGGAVPRPPPARAVPGQPPSPWLAWNGPS